ncbi:hypothetical protein PVAND_004280 [Polypedilum vanderplanki]|uniref:Uncharacterized protein n=1 Tax=Polypedilum vanderplanki TaxID=319348 RepID=A0A9J6BYM6_POLVA|nr:hypothetical protein PVAND_004280 [Polypedilum vanderplanki]
MSNFRSSSQVSVYNYPEYLNPFYEDEQHKRLRFWKIKKTNTSSNSSNSKSKNKDESNGNLSRRGSFNLGSLRDLLPLKAFKIRKPSSTIGINKTSESPPPLRRDFIDYNREDEARYASYDPHFRNTVGGNAFQRNVTYRSSLQNMSTANDLSFNRNNRYRSTIQNGTMPHNNRYVYSGSITPTPKSRYLTDITPGSSMNSISTNPFDDNEYEMENDEGQAVKTQVHMISSQKPGRKKKRRAPPPPIQTNNNKSVVENASEKEIAELRVNEQQQHTNGLDELSRLTAEFESFVKNSDNDIHTEPRIIITTTNDVHVNYNVESKNSNEIQSKNENDENKKNVEIILESKSTVIEGESKQREKPMVVISEKDNNEKNIEIVNEDLRIKEVELKIKETREEESLKINESVKKEREQSPEIIQTIEVHQLKTEIRSYPEVQQLTPTISSREETPDFIPLTVSEKFHVLRIEENENDLLPSNDDKKHNDKPQQIKIEEKPENKKHEEIKIGKEKNEKEVETKPVEISTIKIVEKENVQPKIINQIEAKEPLATALQKDEEKVIIKSSTPIKAATETRIVRDRTPIPLARTEIEHKLNSQGFIKTERPIKFDDDDDEKFIVRRKHSDAENVVLRNSSIISDHEENEPPKVPERRRSVKEIIESINRQQQKLKINQPPSPKVEKKYNYGDQRFSYTEKPAIASKENVLFKLQRQMEHERRINELLDDLQDFNNVNQNYQRTQKFPINHRDTNNKHHGINSINPIPKPRRNI